MRSICLFLGLLLAIGVSARAESKDSQSLILLGKPISLRSGDGVEWSEFAATGLLSTWQCEFEYEPTDRECSLLVYQYDVKQRWEVVLNGEALGSLTQDENLLTHVVRIPASLLQQRNVLVIRCAKGSQPSDDIRLDRVILVDQPVADYLAGGEVQCEVKEKGLGEVPHRLTILDEFGALVPLGIASGEGLAVRVGTIYSLGEGTTIRLPVGQYRIYAGRGFEYSLSKADVHVKSGSKQTVKLEIERHVDTRGYVACDPHIHTLTYSGHGDSTIEERMLSIAGEGIELPVATEHNRYISFEEPARKLRVREYFTPVTGCEVTTPRGHFNIFPVEESAAMVDHRQEDWNILFDQIWKTRNIQVAILNHARDIHSNYRPFGENEHASAIGENLHGRKFYFNAMETINSGATQSDPLQLFYDWMTLLNAGIDVCPIGSSDSHDVSRYIVGQGRTYVRCDDSDPSKVNISEACEAIRQGKVSVSYGLWVEMTVDGRGKSGELTKIADKEGITATVTVKAPHWSSASRLLIFGNGKLLLEKSPSQGSSGDAPFIWQETITLPVASFDMNLVAIAMGPGIGESFWKTAKPYQPISSRWEPAVLGCSGAVWIDGDRDGKKSSARSYAEKVVGEMKSDIQDLLQRLVPYDEAIVCQAFWLLQQSGQAVDTAEVAALVQKSGDEIQAGYRKFREAWRRAEVTKATR